MENRQNIIVENVDNLLKMMELHHHIKEIGIKLKITIEYGLSDTFNEYGKRMKRPGAHKIRHDGNQCCSFCTLEKSVNQAIRRFIYGRPETTSERNLVTQRAYSARSKIPPKRYFR